MEEEHILRDFGLILGADLVAQFARRRGAEISVALVALAVVATLLLQATTAGHADRRLDLIEDPEPETPAG